MGKAQRFVVLSVLASRLVLRAQPLTPLESAASFEVAAIHATGDSDEDLSFEMLPGGRLAARHVTVEFLIAQAFGVQAFQVTHTPEWAREDTFDIDAKAPEDSVLAKVATGDRGNEEARRQEQTMLQSLLIERFHLQAHRETHTGAIFVLERGTGALRLSQPAHPELPAALGNPGGGNGIYNGQGLAGRNVSMNTLAARLVRAVHAPVENRTWLEGVWDFAYRTGANDPDASNLMTIELSLKHVGLRLRRGTGPVSVVMVDAVERPTPN